LRGDFLGFGMRQIGFGQFPMIGVAIWVRQRHQHVHVCANGANAHSAENCTRASKSLVLSPKKQPWARKISIGRDFEDCPLSAEGKLPKLLPSLPGCGSQLPSVLRGYSPGRISLPSAAFLPGLMRHVSSTTSQIAYLRLKAPLCFPAGQIVPSRPHSPPERMQIREYDPSSRYRGADPFPSKTSHDGRACDSGGWGRWKTC
jgi:hypothetical protein